jgi:hypothetical protein
MIAFVEAPAITEQSGLFHLDLKSGADDMPIVMTRHELTRLVFNAHRALDEARERELTGVVRFPKKKGGAGT